MNRKERLAERNGAAIAATREFVPAINWAAFDAVLFDLDGVVTRTERLHALAWQRTFDAFLEGRCTKTGEPQPKFDYARDYLLQIDGKPRLDGIRALLKAREIAVPEGATDDPEGAASVHGLAKKKNAIFLELLRNEPVNVDSGALNLICFLREQGKRLAVVSSSKNCGPVLEAAGLSNLFAVKVDGTSAEKDGLRGKPESDYFLKAARQLNVEPCKAVVIEDAIAGVRAARTGAFGCIIAIDHRDNADALRRAGADVVVRNLDRLMNCDPEEASQLLLLSALDHFNSIALKLSTRRPIVFLDYDGTLTPIVDRPELAVLDDSMRATLRRLAGLCSIVVVSGRERSDVEHRVGLDNVTYVGSHGFDISASTGTVQRHEVGEAFKPAVKLAAQMLQERMQGIDGVIVEDKTYSVAVHHRLVVPECVGHVERCVDAVLGEVPDLRKTVGKKVYELRPNIDWDKGHAVDWILQSIASSEGELVPLYLGDDVTDFDAFRAIRDRGIGILVGRSTQAAGPHYRLLDPSEVGTFLSNLTDVLETELVDPRWCLRYSEYDQSRQGQHEALCTLGNGYFATRGAPADANADGVHYPGTYLAGCYNRLVSDVAGRSVENEDLVNIPNWLPIQIKLADGPWLRASDMERLEYVQQLDLRRGVLTRKLRLRDHQGHIIWWLERRLVSMAAPHCAAIQVRLLLENWSGRLWIRSALDGTVTNLGVKRYRQLENRHLEVINTAHTDDDKMLLQVRTVQSRREIVMAVRTRLTKDGKAPTPSLSREQNGYEIAQLLACDVTAGETVDLEKCVAIFDSQTPAISEPVTAALSELEHCGDFADLLRAHELAWDDLWHIFDVAIETSVDQQTEMNLHLHIFHLLQTASQHSVDLDVGVPARGWHGEAYRGHIFWDELFIFPFINLRTPMITRALLLYRYRRLAEARRAARGAGYRGAMFPWQSAADGREETQSVHLNPVSGRWLPDQSHRQRHVNAAIVFNVWQYFQVTEDLEFLATYGAELMLEIARFWASLAQYDASRRRYSIAGVMGPDEFHTSNPGLAFDKTPGLTNNAYTNIMASWCITRTLDVMDVLPADRRQRLFEVLQLTDQELENWDHISRNLYVPFHDGTIISQFEGYAALEELDLSALRKKFGNVQRVDRLLESEDDDPNNYKVSKQADVLMLFFLFSTEELKEVFDRLGYHFAPEMIGQNIQYYTDRTSHGSTLSWVTHAWILSRWDRKRSWQLFEQALGSDIDDLQVGTTAEGIHLGAMAGSVDLVQRCYTGIEILADTLRFNPQLPEELTCLRATIHYRGHTLNITVTHRDLTVASTSCTAPPVTIAYRGHVRKVSSGQSYTFRLVRAVEKASITVPHDRLVRRANNSVATPNQEARTKV